MSHIPHKEGVTNYETVWIEDFEARVKADRQTKEYFKAIHNNDQKTIAELELPLKGFLKKTFLGPGNEQKDDKDAQQRV